MTTDITHRVAYTDDEIDELISQFNALTTDYKDAMQDCVKEMERNNVMVIIAGAGVNKDNIVEFLHNIIPYTMRVHDTFANIREINEKLVGVLAKIKFGYKMESIECVKKPRYDIGVYEYTSGGKVYKTVKMPASHFDPILAR